MKRSLREVLVASHVAAVAIALLLVWALAAAFQALIGELCSLLVSLVFTITAMLGGPHNSHAASSPGYWVVATGLLQGAICLLAAFLLAQFAFGKNPLRVLRDYWSKLRKGLNA
jgi:hypothetical protein